MTCSEGLLGGQGGRRSRRHAQRPTKEIESPAWPGETGDVLVEGDRRAALRSLRARLLALPLGRHRLVAATPGRTRTAHYAEFVWRRTAAVVAIFLGAVVVGFSPNRWDKVVANLPRGHGIHTHDLIGMALITLGVLVLLRVQRRE